MLNFVCVQKVLGLQVAEGDYLVWIEFLPILVDLLQRFVQDLELFLGHIDHRAERD